MRTSDTSFNAPWIFHKFYSLMFVSVAFETKPHDVEGVFIFWMMSFYLFHSSTFDAWLSF